MPIGLLRLALGSEATRDYARNGRKCVRPLGVMGLEHGGKN